jgi:hypothetical protein
LPSTKASASPLEEKLKHAHETLEHYRVACRPNCARPINTLIVKQNEITQLNKDNARLVAESGAASKSLREGVIVLFVQNLAVCFEITRKINDLTVIRFRETASF